MAIVLCVAFIVAAVLVWIVYPLPVEEGDDRG